MDGYVSQPGQPPPEGQSRLRMPIRYSADQPTPSLPSPRLVPDPVVSSRHPRATTSITTTGPGGAEPPRATTSAHGAHPSMPIGPRSRTPSTSTRSDQAEPDQTPHPTPQRPMKSTRQLPTRALEPPLGPTKTPTLRRKPSTIDAHTRVTRRTSPVETLSWVPSLDAMTTTSAPARQARPGPTSAKSSASTTPHPPRCMVSIEPSRRLTREPPDADAVELSLIELALDPRLPTPALTTHSSSPSTRHSESPGPWSRTSTPTSISSLSPSLIPAKWAPRPPTTSQGQRRPPVTWRGAFAGTDDTGYHRLNSPPLPAPRESLPSTSLGSPVRVAERRPLVVANDDDVDPPSTVDTRTIHEGSGHDINQAMRSRPTLRPPPGLSSGRRPIIPRAVTEGAGANPRSRDRPSPLPLLSTSSLSLSLSGRDPPSSPKKHAVVGLPPTSRHGPSPRPSRDGASDLGPLDEAMNTTTTAIPAVQSNLTELSFSGYRRRGSNDTVASSTTGSRRSPVNAVAATSPTTVMPEHHDGITGHRNRSPSGDCAPSHVDVSRTRSPPSPAATVEGRLRRRGTNPSQTSPANMVPRLALFTRRPGTVSDAGAAEITNRAGNKKGPSTGTGQEDYGRYPRRDRRSTINRSTSTTGTGGGPAPPAGTTGSRKGSTNNRAEPQPDDFFRDRLDPVVIVGGGHGHVSGGHGHAAASSPNFAVVDDRRPSIDSQASGSTEFSTFSLSSAGEDLPSSSLGPLSQEDPIGRAKEHTPDSSRHGLDGVQWELLPMAAPQPTPSPQSSIQPAHEQDAGSFESVPFSNTNLIDMSRPYHPSSAAPAIDMSFIEFPNPHLERRAEDREEPWLRAKASRHLASSFGPQPSTTTAHRLSDVKALHVQVAIRPPPRSLPHYAILDVADLEGSEDLEDLMTDVGRFGDSDDDRQKAAASDPAGVDTDRSAGRQTASALLPGPPVLPPGFHNPRPTSPQVMLRPPESAPIQAAVAAAPQASRRPRTSSLQQVVRIPRVVSSRFRKPPLQSFSRPFSTIRPDMVVGGGTRGFRMPIAIEEQTSDISTAKLPDAFVQQQISRRSSSTTSEFQNSGHGHEFFSFRSRQGSDISCSGSSGIASINQAPGVLPRSTLLAEDGEVWKEYDDLLNEHLSPASDCSDGFPTHSTSAASLSTANLRSASRKPSHTDLPAITTHSGPGTKAIPWSAPAAAPANPRAPQIPQSSDSGRSPVSMNDYFAGLAEIEIAVDARPDPIATMSPLVRKVHSPEAYPAAMTETNQQQQQHSRPSSSTLQPTKKGHGGVDAEMDLRLGALMTSRWLSFGRVLFSPAHDGIKQVGGSGRHERLLVLDGLGNDDWSFYCSLTYPHATVYNLSSSSRSGRPSARKRESGAWQSPANHRQIFQASLANPFPFPKGFFAAVVLRFPAASSEAAYRNAISECQRVLRPGGFLEVSILDLDLMNMGNRARRALRDLKVRMQTADNTVTLKPSSDLILRLLGRRGFENVHCCTLGVPVAGNLVSSSATSVDEPSSPHLSELLKDRSEAGDQGITKMVARVGRWWYTHCYEMSTLLAGTGDLVGSIWDDQALLHECATRQTTFKQLICYAQKPLAPRRRTVSV